VLCCVVLSTSSLSYHQQDVNEKTTDSNNHANEVEQRMTMFKLLQSTIQKPLLKTKTLRQVLVYYQFGAYFVFMIQKVMFVPINTNTV